MYFLIILDDEGHDEEYVQRRLNHLFMKQTNLIKNNRSEKQQAWNISVKQCALSERAYLNQKNFQIFFHHASQYRLVRNAYYALLNDFREVRIYDLMSLEFCIPKFLRLSFLIFDIIDELNISEEEEGAKELWKDSKTIFRP